MTKLPKYVEPQRDRYGEIRYYYFRRSKRHKRIPLPGLPWSIEFMQAYTLALAGEVTPPPVEIGAARSRPGSVAAAVAAYLGSVDFSSLADATKGDRRRDLDRFRETHGEKNFAGLQRKHVELMLAERPPHAARNFLKILRALVSVALRAGLCETDPTASLRVKVRASAHGFRTWTEEDIAKFETFYPVGSRARLAFGLLIHTGQRRGDIILMGRQHVRGSLLTVRQSKTGATVDIPILPELAAILAASSADHLTFLVTATGKPFTGTSFTHWFGGLCREAGLPLGLSAHGLR